MEIDVLDIDIRSKEVESAGISCLIAGIIISIFAVVSQSLVFIHKFVLWKFIFSELCTLFFAIIAVLLIKLWIQRTNFTLYCCLLNDDIDFNYIRKVHKIVDINDKYLVFVSRKDLGLYNIWKCIHGDRGNKVFANEFKRKHR